VSKVDAANIHALLNYIVSTATLTGKVGGGHILVPLSVLMAGQDDEAPAEQEDILLKVSIQVEWRDATDIDLEDEYNCELTDEQELTDESESESDARSAATTSKNKKSQ
jgi:hypothetical protein